MTARTVLVTGAAGFIGRWSVPPLLARGYRVHAVVGRKAAPAPSQLDGAVLHRADLLDHRAVDAVLAQAGASHLLHFAWIATPGVYGSSPDNARWAAAGEYLLRRFSQSGGSRAVVAGSCAEYDWSAVGVCDERSSPLAGSRGSPVTPYAAGKLALQAALTHIGAAQGMSSAWGRLFFSYGPAEPAGRLVASVILHVLRGQEAPCTHGRQVRSFLHVADVGAAFAALLDGAVEGPVNIGSAEAVTLAAVARQIAAQVGRPELVQLGARPASPSEPALLLPAVARLRDEVGWQPRFTLAAGLADSIAWWRMALAEGPT